VDRPGLAANAQRGLILPRPTRDETIPTLREHRDVAAYIGHVQSEAQILYLDDRPSSVPDGNRADAQCRQQIGLLGENRWRESHALFARYCRYAMERRID
jgi:hypothetical protein